MRGLAYLPVAMLGLLLGWSAGVAAGPLPMFAGPRAAVHGWLYGDPPGPPPLSIDTVGPSSAPYASPAPGAPTARQPRPPTFGAAPARTAPPRSRNGDAASAAPLLPRALPPIRPPPSPARVPATGGPDKDQTGDAPTTAAAPTMSQTPTSQTPTPTMPEPPTTDEPDETSAAETPAPTTSEVQPRCPTPRHRHCSRHS